MNRRDFIPRMITGSAIIAVLPATMSSCEKEDMENPDDNGNNADEGGEDSNNANTIDLQDPDFVALRAEGGFAYKGNYIVINTGNDTFSAFSSQCTHSGCTVNYSATSNNLPCPCHGSVFSMTGSVLKGPATRSLQKFSVTKTGNVLTIS